MVLKELLLRVSSPGKSADSGCDALLVETSQDLLQVKAAINGCRQAIGETRRDIVFENRKQTFASNAAPVGDNVGDNVEASNENDDIVKLEEVKEELEKVDVWSERNT